MNQTIVRLESNNKMTCWLEIDGIRKMRLDTCVFVEQESNPQGLKVIDDIRCLIYARGVEIQLAQDFLNNHASGSMNKFAGAITVDDEHGIDAQRWNFKDGWIIRQNEINLDASQENEPLTFGFEIAVSDITPGV